MQSRTEGQDPLRDCERGTHGHLHEHLGMNIVNFDRICFRPT